MHFLWITLIIRHFIIKRKYHHNCTHPNQVLIWYYICIRYNICSINKTFHFSHNNILLEKSITVCTYNTDNECIVITLHYVYSEYNTSIIRRENIIPFISFAPDCIGFVKCRWFTVKISQCSHFIYNAEEHGWLFKSEYKRGLKRFYR